VVQEALLRLHTALERGERIELPRAYVATIATRLSIDVLRSARVRRESYVGEWLPEPLVASADDDPARKAEMADSLSLAFLVLLESLSPEQRAAFLLREVFDEPYDRIADIIGTSEQNARQLATRARRHVDSPPRRRRRQGARCPTRGPRPREGGALAGRGLRVLARVAGSTMRREEVNGQPGARFFDAPGVSRGRRATGGRSVARRWRPCPSAFSCRRRC
jgi:RNA polymerase sigma factor (sigma-70 family)